MTDVIRDLPRDDRPRERLMKHGAETLSDAELVAIILGSGRRGRNAIQVARDILSDGLGIRHRELAQLVKIGGVGPAKATRVAAAFELGRRWTMPAVETPPHYQLAELGTRLVRRYSRCRQERLGMVLLDSRHRIKEEREIFVGSISSALVSPGDIMRHALLNDSPAVVIHHNHPSGDPTPSQDDQAFTTRLKNSLGLVDIELVDHLVTGVHGFVSMKEAKMI